MDKRFELHVTKATGFLQIEIVDRGTLTQEETDRVMVYALKEFSQYSKFVGERETRAVKGEHYEAVYHPSVIPAWVSFEPGTSVDFEPVNNRVKEGV